MADRPMLRIVTYDIASDRRRRRVADILEARASRVQESVFEARLTHTQAERLLDDLKPHIAPADSLRLYTVSDAMLPRCSEQGGPAIDGGGRFWLL